MKNDGRPDLKQLKNQGRLNLFYFLEFLLPFITAFVVPKDIMNPFIIGPLIWVYLLVGLILIIVAYKLIGFRQPITLSINAIDVLLFANCFFLVLSTLLTGKSWEYDRFLTLTVVLIFYYVAKTSLKELSGDKQKSLLTGLLISGFIITLFITSAIGIFQKFKLLPSFNYLFPVTGNFPNPARYGIFLACIISPVSGIILYSLKYKRLPLYLRISGTVLIFLGYIALAESDCRAAFLGCFVSTLFLLFCLWKQPISEMLSSVKFKVLCSIIAVLFLVLLFLWKPQSVYGRLLIWKVSVTMFEDNPVVGVGYGNFEYSYQIYQANYFDKKSVNLTETSLADFVQSPYNEFLNILCEQGIIGFLLFLGFLYSIFNKVKYILNDPDSQLLGLIAYSTIISFLICGLFSYPFDVLPANIIFYLSLGIISATGYNSGFFSIDWKVSKGIAILSGIVLISSSLLLIGYSLNKYKSYKRWHRATFYFNDLNELRNLFPRLKNDEVFLQSYTELLLQDKKYNEVIAILNRLEKFRSHPLICLTLAQAYSEVNQNDAAEKYFKLSINMVPNRIYPRFLLLKFYFKIGEVSKARKLADDILKMKPKVPSLVVEDIKNEVKKLIR